MTQSIRSYGKNGGRLVCTWTNAQQATLSSVYIFDIGSQTWIEQTVTSANGTESIGAASETDPRGAIYNTVFPRRRMSACAVVGSAKDKTSHNIFVLGGQSESTALLETWVLSLPRYATSRSPIPLRSSLPLHIDN